MRLVTPLLVGAVLTTAACGGGMEPSAQPPQHKAPARKIHACARAWHCGTPLNESDLPDAFFGWPEVQAIYRSGDSFVVYTSLPENSYGRAVGICRSVFEDLVGEGAEERRHQRAIGRGTSNFGSVSDRCEPRLRMHAGLDG
jgi:hypothetical protein